MPADLPENYLQHMDVFQFIKDVHTDWDDTRILETESGNYITIARKAKGCCSWFIGSIADENARIANINLDFLHKGKKNIAGIYRDADNANWQNNPEANKIEQKKVDSNSKLKINPAAGGALAISVKVLE